MSNDETSCSAYWAAVESTASDVAQRVKDGEDFSDALHAEIDGSWWITYYHAARAVMQHTANDDAAFDAEGADACDGIGSFDGIVTRCAFYAMCADVVSRYEEPEEEEEEEEGPRYDPQPGDTCTLVDGSVCAVVAREGESVTLDITGEYARKFGARHTMPIRGWWAVGGDSEEWARP